MQMKKNKKKQRNTTAKQRNNAMSEAIKLQFGNFILERMRIGGGEWLWELRTVMRDWIMRFTDSTYKFAWLDAFASDVNMHNALEAWIVLMYHTTHCNPDGQWFKDMKDVLDSLRDRAIENAPKGDSSLEDEIAILDAE